MLVHKIAFSNHRIIAVFKEVCFSDLFVCAVVNLLKAPVQHNTEAGKDRSVARGLYS